MPGNSTKIMRSYTPLLDMMITLVLISSFTLAASAYAVSPDISWKSALRPQGVAGETLILAADGQALYTILLPAEPSTMAEKAAADLAQWLGEMSGAAFRVCKESESDAPRERFISIGATRALVESGLACATLDLKEEGYAIDGKDGNLFLVGGATRGVINAVYALLEEDLDCRWYSRYSQTIPKKETLQLNVVKRSYTPVLDIRDPFYLDAFDGAWSLRNRTNSPSADVPVEWGGHKSYALFVHTFSTLVPPDKYFAEHPEYYSENGSERNPGQLCVTNPEVLRITVESVMNILAGNPAADIISVSQNDSAPCCACERCKAVTEAEGGLSGPLLQFVNAVADEVGKEYPKVTISTLAYLDTTAPPKTVRPRANVAIQLCTDSHAWAEPFLTVEETEPFQSWMKAWAAIGADIHIWDYTCNFSHYLGPMPNWQVVSDSIRFFIANNAKGVMLQGVYETPGAADGYMRCWVWSKLLWNPSLDTRALMKDFVYGYYGEAAGLVWEYQELLWSTWESERHSSLKSPQMGIRYPMIIFNDEFMMRARACFVKARAMTLDDETRRRVEEAELQALYAELERVAPLGRSKGPEFYVALDRFERIARAMKVTHIQEGSANIETWIAEQRKPAE